MGSITRSFSIDVIGVTTYVIFRWRKVTAPTVEIDRRVFGPAPAVTNNFSITDLDAATYYFDTYISSNGVSLTTLMATYTMDVKNNLITNERRYYWIGSGTGNAPDGGQSLVDPYLDGKNVTGVFQRGFGYLMPGGEWSRTAGGVDLVPPLSFNTDDVYMVEVTYLVESDSNTSNILGLFDGFKTITASLTLDNTYRKKRNKLNGTADRLVVTMEAIGGIPDGTWFYFGDNDGGAQLQTKIISPDGSFKWSGNTTSEIWVGKGEHLWLEKWGLNFEKVQAHEGLDRVYERFVGTCTSHLNALAEDGSLQDADDWPRLWWFLNNKLTANLVITDNNLDAGGYVRPANKQGLFIISPTKKKFRMPDTRKLTDRALASFDPAHWNEDVTRAYDYPGGFQAEMVGAHNHEEVTYSANQGGALPRKKPVGFGDVVGGEQASGTFTLVNDGTEQRLNNIGIINFRRA